MTSVVNAIQRGIVADSKYWVIKFGSAVLTKTTLELNKPIIKSFVRQIAEQIGLGKQIVIVSSGAVAIGVSALGWSKKPDQVHHLQAAAAIGQAGLIQTYQYFFEAYGLQTAQILLSQNDMESRERYLNAKTTIKTLLQQGVIPIINENDSIATEEICFGDNDALASYVANSIEADSMLLLTDQNGFYDDNPQINSRAKLLTNIDPTDHRLDSMAGSGGMLGRGGMKTKLTAARIAARSGTQTIIANGFSDNIIKSALDGSEVGTWFQVQATTHDARKRWLGSRLRSKGSIAIDRGAKTAILKGGNSLLPIGVLAVNGQFERGDLIQVTEDNTKVIAKGLTNYSSIDIQRLIKTHSGNIQTMLGYCHADEIIHCDNLILLHY